MSVNYQIAGYDKRTEKLAREFDIPADQVEAVMKVARVSAQQAASFGSICLDPSTVRMVGRQLGKSIYSEFYDWFLEPSAA